MLRLFRRYQKTRIEDPNDHPFYQEWGEHDQVFCASTREFSTPTLPSLTALRFVLDGQYVHHVGPVPLRLEAGQCLVSAAGRPYAVEIESRRLVTTLEIHYSHETARSVAAASTCRDLEHALEFDCNGVPELIEQVVRPDPACAPVLHSLASTMQGFTEPDPDRVQAQIEVLLAHTLQTQAGRRREWDRLPARKPSTRRELYRRLIRARDYMASCFRQPISIRDLAEVACLSPYHFQRLYRQVFGHSVAHAIRTLRMEWAADRLETGRPVVEVARSAGYAHESSFSRAYRRHFGVAPSAHRQN